MPAIYYLIGFILAIAWVIFVKVGSAKSNMNKLNGLLSYVFVDGGLEEFADATLFFYLSAIACIWLWPFYVFYLVFVTVLYVIDYILY